MSPSAALSRRNCSAMWRRAAPSARSQADLAGAFEHRDERDVGDADGADEQGDAPEHEQQEVEVALHVVAHPRRLGWERHLEHAGLVGAEGHGNLSRDEGRGADGRLDDDSLGRHEVVPGRRRLLRHDHRAEEFGGRARPRRGCRSR